MRTSVFLVHHLLRLGTPFAVLVAILGLSATGCARGILYTRIVKPYTLDFHDAPLGTKACRVNEHVVKEPVSRAGISVRFTSRVVQEAAREAGIANLYYADIEILSILNGIYERKTLIIYGD